MAASIRQRMKILHSQLSSIFRVNFFTSNISTPIILNVRQCSTNLESKFSSEDTGVVGENRLSEHAETRKLPQWLQTRRGQARRFAQQGRASGIDPSIMWPTQSELQNIIKDEAEWGPSLQQMQSEIDKENRVKELKRRKREEYIAACMAKMPKLEAEYRKKKAEKQAALEEQQEKRNRLLHEARDKLGYAIDPRSPRFQKMVEEVEKEERKRKKELKRKGIHVVV